jgi:hypothetical protein
MTPEEQRMVDDLKAELAASKASKFQTWLTSAIFENWKTTMSGAALGVIQVIGPILNTGASPTKADWLKALGAVLFGLVAKG